MNAQVIRILVNIQIIKITGKINSTPVASKSPSDFDTEVKPFPPIMHCYSFFLRHYDFFRRVGRTLCRCQQSKINAQIHFGMIAFGGGILLVAVALVLPPAVFYYLTF